MATARSVAITFILVAIVLATGYGLSIGGNGVRYISNVPLSGYLRYLLKESFFVKAGQDTTVNFTLPSYANATVEGNYTIGVTDQVVRMVIVKQIDLRNWREGKSVKLYYDSGEVTSSNIGIHLTYGDYVMVFQNPTSKLILVEGEITLTYPMN